MAEKKPKIEKETKKIVKPKKKVVASTKESSKVSETTEVFEINASEENTALEGAEVKSAKAGKRSAKALKEEEEKLAKEERKSQKDSAETSAAPKVTQKPARPKIERKGKKYRKLVTEIDRSKLYSINEALTLATITSPSSFDATVELHVRLGVDPRHADQNIRDNVVLPAGTGKTIRVAVFGEEKDVEAAKKAGADSAKADEFLEQLEKNVIDFDILISTPKVMVKLSKYARLLGPKGLMPNPKNGTVTTDVAKAVKEAKAGKVEYRIDTSGIVHLGIGKVSFGEAKLLENATAVLSSIKGNKPASIKGNYVKSVFITTTMGPSIPVDRNI